jgi:hypothetical protein
MNELHLFAGGGGVSSAESFAEIPPYVLSKLTNIADRRYYNDNETEFYQNSQSGMMSKPLTEHHGEDELMLSVEGSLARISVLQERVRELPERNLDYGEKWPELLAKLDLDTSSWKTAQCSLFEDSEPSLQTFPKWGTMRNGELLERIMPAHLTSATEFGYSLPTPTCNPELPNKNSNTNGPKNLVDVAMGKRDHLWPTPDANMGQRGTQPEWTPKRKSGHTAQYTINQAVRDRETFPTPLQSDWKCRGPNSKQQGLPELIKKFPTPNSRDWKDSGSTQGNQHSPNLGTVVGGHLNPDWVEWLMGWPIGWTDLKPLEMDKFRQWLKLHGKY